MLLGGIIEGEKNLAIIAASSPRRTIAGYVEERIASPYTNPYVGAKYITRPYDYNNNIPSNLYLVVGDEQLEVQSSRVAHATSGGPSDGWRLVHGWMSDLITDIRQSWDTDDSTVFIDCNPSFTVYTEFAMSASDRLIIPFSADGSSKRAVRAVLSLIYGITRVAGAPQSEFVLKTTQFRMTIPKIYCYVGNRLTQMNLDSAAAFKTVVVEIGKEILEVYKKNPNIFYIHPTGSPYPRTIGEFRRMFQFEINDANSASVVSGGLGIPISVLSDGNKKLAGKTIRVNQTQIDKQKPNIRAFVQTIE